MTSSLRLGNIVIRIPHNIPTRGLSKTLLLSMPTTSTSMDGPLDRRTFRRMDDGWVNSQMDGWKDGQMDDRWVDG